MSWKEIIMCPVICGLYIILEEARQRNQRILCLLALQEEKTMSIDTKSMKLYKGYPQGYAKEGIKM